MKDQHVAWIVAIGVFCVFMGFSWASGYHAGALDRGAEDNARIEALEAQIVALDDGTDMYHEITGRQTYKGGK